VILSGSSITSSYNFRASQSRKNMGMVVGWRKISRLLKPEQDGERLSNSRLEKPKQAGEGLSRLEKNKQAGE
jgi:hypothetical protein